MSAGAAVCPVPESASTFPIELADWIAGHRISVWYSVPSILASLVRHGKLERHDFAHLRTVIFAGEVFPIKYLQACMDELSRARFFNLYGPTETNVITWYEVERRDRTVPVPIGKACANMEVFALGADGEVVTEPGQEGELYARGSCLAQGYWGDEEKTRQVFVTDPRPGHPTERVYRTGDLVSLDAEGDYLFIGRRDHMVKRRGYRIELGEIESVLYSHDSVKEAALVAEPDDEGGSRLTAFVVVAEGFEQAGSDLETHILSFLPKYMLPDAIVFQEALPKTSTGKVDRRALTRERKGE